MPSKNKIMQYEETPRKHSAYRPVVQSVPQQGEDSAPAAPSSSGTGWTGNNAVNQFDRWRAGLLPLAQKAVQSHGITQGQYDTAAMDGYWIRPADEVPSGEIAKERGEYDKMLVIQQYNQDVLGAKLLTEPTWENAVAYYAGAAKLKEKTDEKSALKERYEKYLEEIGPTAWIQERLDASPEAQTAVEEMKVLEGDREILAFALASESWPGVDALEVHRKRKAQDYLYEKYGITPKELNDAANYNGTAAAELDQKLFDAAQEHEGILWALIGVGYQDVAEHEKRMSEEAAAREWEAGYPERRAYWEHLAEVDRALTDEEKAAARAGMRGLVQRNRAQNGFFGGMSIEDINLHVKLNNRTNPGTGFASGLFRAWGADRALDKIGLQEGGDALRATQRDMPIADGIGNLAGNVALYSTISRASQGMTSQIPGFENLQPWQQRAINASLAAGSKGMYQAAMNMMTKEEWDAAEQEKVRYYAEQDLVYEPVKYSAWKQAMNVAKTGTIGAVGGAAGSIASDAVSGLAQEVLTRFHLQKPIMEMLQNTASGVAYTAGSIGATYHLLPEEERPSLKQMTADLALSLLLSAGASVIQTGITMAWGRAELEAQVAEAQQAYKRVMSGEVDAAGKVAALEQVQGITDNLRASTTAYYYPGQQDFINKITRVLDAVDDQIALIRADMGNPQASLGPGTWGQPRIALPPGKGTGIVPALPAPGRGSGGVPSGPWPNGPVVDQVRQGMVFMPGSGLDVPVIGIERTALPPGANLDAAEPWDYNDGGIEGAGSRIKFGSEAKSVDKLNRQMNNRGWAKDSVTGTVDDAFTTRKATNRATGNPATVYYNKDGSHVIVDDITNEIVQVSDKFDVNWKPDDSIINPYLP